MRTIETIAAMIEESHENYRATATAAREAVKTLETIYGETIEKTPADSIAAFVDVVGYDMAVCTIATLVNRYAWDGRISRRSAEWAKAQENAWNEEAAERMWLYTNIIHVAHINQLAAALMKYEPAPKEEAATVEEPKEEPETARPAVQVFPHLSEALAAHYEEETALATDHIANGYEADKDSGLRQHLTETRWNAYKAGTLTREKAVDLATRRAAKTNAKELEKKLAHLDRIATAPALEYAEISVEWKRNAYWGNNPTATVWTNDGTYTGRASGCGYDKLTAAVGQALNQSPAVLRALYTVKETYLAKGNTCRRANRTTDDNRDAINYGAGYGVLPYFEGGVGMSSFKGVFSAMGFGMRSDRFAKHYDHFSVTIKEVKSV